MVTKILGHGAFRKRVMEMGFVRGREVTAVLNAPLRDPVKYRVAGYEISLRRSEARLIEVMPADNAAEAEALMSAHTNILPSDTPLPPAVRRHRHINVVLIGNPNCGKTSLFNDITGSREHVGNYSGVTVGATGGKMQYKGYEIHVVDLPGTYSLASYSPEELYVRRYLRDETPDVIVNVVDASNLERNLYLTTELIDMDRSMVIALNMYDELEASGNRLDYRLLGNMIGVPIVPTVSKNGAGVDNLLDTVIDVYNGRNETVRHIHVHLGTELEKAVTAVKDAVKANGDTGHHISPRYIAIKLLEQDPETEKHVDESPGGDNILKVRDTALAELNDNIEEDVAETIAAEKYGFISGALAETLTRQISRSAVTETLDRIFTNKYIGYPLFMAVMALTFWLTFSVGQYPMDWMQAGVDWLSSVINSTFPPGILKDLVADGIIGGVGGVIIFLPNILILYFCISFMEDSGYMSRAAFIMDKVMHRLGVHGKSFIPLVMGFGCNVPAITASRTIESKSSRLITILINPFMSCSARLPIYVLLIGTFFPQHAALVLISLYVGGIVVAAVTARLLRRFWFGKDETPFVMELPPYRMPTWRNMLRHTWGKGEQYLRKMAGLILVASIIVWALNYFPVHSPAEKADMERAASEERIDPAHDSYMKMLGKAINPVMQPIGFTWRQTVAALAGVPAKEIVVSTLGVLYANDEAVEDATLGKRLEAPNPVTHQPDFTPAVALAFMVFILLYCPCVATLTAIYRETGKWFYPAFSVIYNTSVAWIAALATYRLALLLL